MATGASLIERTVTFTVAVSVPPAPSLILYVKLSDPNHSGSGEYVIVNPALIVVVPFSPLVAPVIVKVSRSRSVSLDNTFITIFTSSFVVEVSSLATGLSLIGPTVTSTVAESVLLFPSVT